MDWPASTPVAAPSRIAKRPLTSTCTVPSACCRGCRDPLPHHADVLPARRLSRAVVDETADQQEVRGRLGAQVADPQRGHRQGGQERSVPSASVTVGPDRHDEVLTPGLCRKTPIWVEAQEPPCAGTAWDKDALAPRRQIAQHGVDHLDIAVGSDVGSSPSARGQRPVHEETVGSRVVGMGVYLHAGGQPLAEVRKAPGEGACGGFLTVRGTAWTTVVASCRKSMEEQTLSLPAESCAPAAGVRVSHEASTRM